LYACEPLHPLSVCPILRFWGFAREGCLLKLVCVFHVRSYTFRRVRLFAFRAHVLLSFYKAHFRLLTDTPIFPFLFAFFPLRVWVSFFNLLSAQLQIFKENLLFVCLDVFLVFY
jgi:hypothetical protein